MSDKTQIHYNNNNNDKINDKNISNTFVFINETYDNLSYFDLYGNSVLIFIFVTLFVFIVFSYCKIMESKEDIANDWVNQRCKPQNMLFAGLITHPEDTTPLKYTSDNFQYCVQSILTNISSYALQPFYFMIKSLTQVFEQMRNSIQEIRELINKIRNNLKEFTQDIMGRLLNIMIPMQKMFIALMDTFQKIQGTMSAGLYTMLGSYYTLQALMGAILELIVKLLVTLVIIIVGLWVLPFTWPAAASMTVVFTSIAIPLSIIIYFMTEVLHIKSSSIPKLRCFDKNTLITLQNGNKIRIKDINVGDTLENGSYVTAKIKVTSVNLKIYRLNNIIVSESHLIKYNNNWIRVSEHPLAQQIEYDEPFLYCLNTSNKLIELDNYIFSDWDEIINNNIDLLVNNTSQRLVEDIQRLEDIHEYLDDGFEEDTLIKLQNDKQKEIKQIKIGDILENGSVIYGLVEIEARKLRKYSNKISPNKLYHLLTTDGSLTINSTDVKDYNNIIDKFII
jgi:hypothetical protein